MKSFVLFLVFVLVHGCGCSVYAAKPKVIQGTDQNEVEYTASFTNTGTCAESVDRGDWIASTSNLNTGSCGITVTTGAFSEIWYCDCQSPLNYTVEKYSCNVIIESATSLKTHTFSGNGTDVDRQFTLWCKGKK